MATFGGVNIFGDSPIVRVGGDEIARQETGYPGVGGVESTIHGDRGDNITVECFLWGPSLGELQAKLLTIESYKDGIPRTFACLYGVFFWCQLVSWRPTDRMRLATKYGYCGKYEVRLRRL